MLRNKVTQGNLFPINITQILLKILSPLPGS